MRRHVRLVGALCATALLVPACSSSGATPDPETTSPSATTGPSDEPTSEEPTTEEPTPTDEPTTEASVGASGDFAVPDPITEEYVDRVVNEIYAQWGAITKSILEQPADPSGIVDAATREEIGSLFVGEYLLRRYEEGDDVLRGARDGLKPPSEYGAVRWRTRKIFESSEDCLVVAGDFDYSDTATEPGSILTALSLKPARNGTGDTNPTGWQVMDALANRGDGEVLADDVMLEASLGDFGDLLTHECNGVD